VWSWSLHKEEVVSQEGLLRRIQKCGRLDLVLVSWFLAISALFRQIVYIPWVKSPWHASFTPIPISFLFPHHLLYIVQNMCIYTHICVQTVHELPLLPNNNAVKHFYTNRERCEVLIGYLSLGRRPGGNWANTWHWTERFTVCFWNRKQQQPQLLSHVLPYRISSLHIT
jgi:hypothetical protein